MNRSILYLGDTALRGAAGYLAGVIHHCGWPFEYVPSDRPSDAALIERPWALFVLSDYPAANLAAALQERICEQVAAGAGLLMIGGWESYHGLGGNWDNTPVGRILPVEIGSADDRLNCDQPLLVRQVSDHPTVAGLPWHSRPPGVGGLNRIAPQPAAQLVLEARRFRPREESGGFVFEPAESYPLLIVGRHGSGRTAAFASDAAPHWVGGLVDWGPGRIVAQAPGAETIEVGDLYARFFGQLLAWTGGELLSAKD
jgi:hypothetical protein